MTKRKEKWKRMIYIQGEKKSSQYKLILSDFDVGLADKDFKAASVT